MSWATNENQIGGARRDALALAGMRMVAICPVRRSMPESPLVDMK